ncbi:related to Protein disulfide-isomerase MPD1 [Zygosaccharomyces bailii ISA1307]|nr:related to Protein disulfide-isomerase MPD1 [Zygosaccharomyces bailii ISA1307]
MWTFKILILLCFGSLAPALAQNFYDEDPHIMELTPKSFEKVIHRTNYTTIVEFYAPWCGYCQQLKKTMKKAARNLEGVLQVAAVNCDLAKNKQICAQNKVQGFPTLMVYRPPKVDVSKPFDRRINLDNHASEIYKGERKLAPIVDFALSRMKNYVKRLLNINKLNAVFDKASRPSVVLFSKKDKLSPVYNSIALDWLGVLDCFIIPNRKVQSLNDDDNLAKTHPKIFTFLQKTMPDQKGSEESLLVVFDSKNDEYHVFEGKSLVKEQIAEFLTKKFDLIPNEGPGSRRQYFLDSVKNGKNRKLKHDEL